MLQGELDVVLDLINLMEGQHFLGVANIALPSNLQLENQQQALRLQQKVSQLKVHLTHLPPHNCTHSIAPVKLSHGHLASQTSQNYALRAEPRLQC